MIDELWGACEDEKEAPISTCISQIPPAEQYIHSPFIVTHSNDQNNISSSIEPPLNDTNVNYVMESMKLMKYNNQISNIKQLTHKNIHKHKVSSVTDLPPQPHMKDVKKVQPSLDVYEKHVPEICKSSVKQLSGKAVASVLYQAGFERTDNQCLDILTHYFIQYLEKFCCTLKEQNDNILMGHKVKYFDAFEETLYAHEIQGYEELISFAKSHIHEFLQKLNDRTRVIQAEFKVLQCAPQNSARTLQGYLDGVNSIDLLKGELDPEPEAPNAIPTPNTSNTTNFLIDSNGLFFD